MVTEALPREIKTEQELDLFLNRPKPEQLAYLATLQAEEAGLTDPVQIGDTVKRMVMESLRESGLTHIPVSKPNPQAPGAVVEGFDSFQEFLVTVGRFAWKGIGDGRLSKALAEGDSPGGGFLVPEQFRAELLALAIEDAIVRPRATTIPMTSQSIKIPAVHDTTHAVSIFGGVRAYWESEAASHTTSQPTFSQVRLEAIKLAGYTQASMELLEDSAISLEALLMKMFGTALGYFEDDAFISGTGAGQPLGILNADALVTVAKETGQEATSLVKENLDKMFARMLPRSTNRAIWLANSDVIPRLFSLAQNVGTGGAPVMVMNIANAPTFSIYGRPVIFSEKCKTLGTAGDIYFVDFSYYLLGDRQALTMGRSEHVAFVSDQMTWKFVERVDGRPWLKSALTPRNGNSTLSPFVSLATRS